MEIGSVLSKDKYLLVDWEGRILPIPFGRKELKPYYFQNPKNLYKEIKNVNTLVQTLIQELKEDGKADSPPARRPSSTGN